MGKTFGQRPSAFFPELTAWEALEFDKQVFAVGASEEHRANRDAQMRARSKSWQRR